MFENKIIEAVETVYFTAVAFMMYYFINDVAYIGGIGVTFRHLFALLLFVSAFAVFIAKPRMDRATVSVKSALVYAVPLLVVLTASMLVWMIQKSGLETIMRGISGCFFFTNWLSCALAAAAMLYVFGERGIWYNMGALVGANLLMIIMIIADNGIGVFMSEYVELIVSFAENTGDVIVQAEIHELAFCLGAYLIYMLYKPKKKVWFWVLFGLGLFCFLAAFKRIAIIAMAAVFVIRLLIWLSGRFSAKTVCRTVDIIMLVACGILILYIYLIRSDLFSELERAGVDTSGRAYVYSHVNRYYEFSPSFLGNGIGYLTYQLNENISLGVTAVHNDFLQFFVDLGFYGYILWLLSMTILRTRYFGKHNHNDADTATISCLLIVYLLIVSSTDNTINYPLLTTVIGIIIMGNSFDKSVEEKSKIWK